ncbi:MAG: phage holin family protein [Proteobacteria bacterium]|nr:phage holin family protein [Pseudomonadota bacterium]
MDILSRIISGLKEGTAGRVGGIAAQILQDRLELLALELREAKIRFVQTIILVCMGTVFSLLSLLLLVLAGIYILTPEWRIYGLAAGAMVSLIAGMAVFILLRRLLKRKSFAFDQSLAELKKDTTCFSTKN